MSTRATNTDLRGQVVVVTGASSGIGRAIAMELSRAGAKLVLTARRADRLASLQASLPGPAVCHSAAIEDRNTPDELLDLALSTFGRIDGLVNNAGMLVSGPLDEVDLDGLAQMTRVNFDAPVRACHVFARALKARGSGAIVNVTSVGAYLSHSSMAVYGGLKQALETYTTALRVELKGSGVRVGSIAPGTTDTEIFEGLRARGQPVRADLSQSLAPEDVALAVRFMLERPPHVSVGRMLLVSSSEMA